MVGATGLLGRRLCAALLARGDEVRAVSRGGAAGIDGARDVRWDPAEGPAPAEVAQGVDAVVNLAGAPIGGKRWTAARKRLIRESRTLTTRGVVDALMADGAARVLVNASGADYYGVPEEPTDETAPPGSTFLAETGVAWEREARRAEEAGVRVVLLRSGVVLAPEGGGLAEMARPVKLFAGGPLGGGAQWLPWIHIDDEIAIVLHALDRDDVSGPLNLAAPAPVRQREFVKALGRVLHRPASLPAPGIAVRLALGEMATLALDSRHVVPAAVLASGYEFRWTEVEAALRDIYS